MAHILTDVCGEDEETHSMRLRESTPDDTKSKTSHFNFLVCVSKVSKTGTFTSTFHGVK